MLGDEIQDTPTNIHMVKMPFFKRKLCGVAHVKLWRSVGARPPALRYYFLYYAVVFSHVVKIDREKLDGLIVKSVLLFCGLCNQVARHVNPNDGATCGGVQI